MSKQCVVIIHFISDDDDMSDTNTETKKNANNEDDKMKAYFKKWLDEHRADDKDTDMVIRAASHLTQFLESLKGDGILPDITPQSIFEEAMKDADAKLKDQTNTATNPCAIEPWRTLIPRLESWFTAHGIDWTKTQVYVHPPDDDKKKHCTTFIRLPGDDGFDIFNGDTPDDLFNQITKRCESRVPAAPTSNDAVHLTAMNLPTNDLAYTNAVYINDLHLERGNLLFPETTTHVKINDSRIFPLIKHPLVQKGCIAMSSLQRDSFVPQLPLAKLTKVSPCDIIAETKAADSLSIEFEPVANFKVDVDPLALIDFLRTEFKDQMVYPGTKLGSIKFAKRVFVFRVIQGEGRITESTQIYWSVHPKSKDVVNIVHAQLKAKINDENAALKALLKEWDALQVQMSKVRHCFDLLLKSSNQE